MPLEINKNIELEEIITKYGIIEFKLKTNNNILKKMKNNKILKKMIVNYIRQKFLKNFPQLYKKYTIYILFTPKKRNKKEETCKIENEKCLKKTNNEKKLLLIKLN